MDSNTKFVVKIKGTKFMRHQLLFGESCRQKEIKKLNSVTAT